MESPSREEKIHVLWPARLASLRDMLRHPLSHGLYAVCRAVWHALRRGLSALAGGPAALDLWLWRLGFFHAKSRWLRKRIVAPDGNVYALRPMEEAVYYEIYVEGVYDGCVFPPSGTIIDCGAHIGMFSLYARRRSPGARILAMEPSPLNREMLELNVARNRAAVDVRPWAVADRSGDGEIHFGGEWANDYCLEPVVGNPSAIRIPVTLKTLDEIAELERIDRCDLLKIDVEGAELAALRGATKLLARTQEVFLEVHKLALEPKDVASLLEAAGFACRFFGETRHIVFLDARRPTPARA